MRQQRVGFCVETNKDHNTSQISLSKRECAMKMRRLMVAFAIGLICVFLLQSTGFARERVEQQGVTDEILEYRVPQLPEDNLIKNPWFRTGNRPSLDYWVEATPSAGGWVASQKPGNPTQDNTIGTAARISTGRGTDNRGRTVEPGVDTYLYQIVSADPQKRTLKFDMYWVTHTVDPVEVTIYGGSSADGPWTEIWKPFYQRHTKMIIPTSGRGQDLWKYYSETTDMVTMTLPNTGYPYYKIEIHANLPDKHGGLKITGVYFAVN